jgi:hypothetical protein
LSNLELTYNNFVNRISSAARKDISAKYTRRALITLSSFIAIILIAVVLEAIFEFSTPVRKFVFFGYFSALFATASTILALAYLEFSSSSRDDKINLYAQKIGAFFPDIKDNLINALQIYRSTKQSKNFFSNELAVESINQVNKHTEGINFQEIVSNKENRKLTFLLSGSILLSAILFLIFPSTFQSSAYRIINYNYTFIENTLGIAYEVTPGNIEISKGENVKLGAKILFNDPNYKTDEITLNTKTLSNEGVELSENSQKISSISANEFETTLANINSNTVYRFEYKGIKSEEYKISITSRPVIKSVKITVYPPAYTRLPSQIIERSEIYTIAGSKIYVEVNASDDLSKSLLAFNNGNELKMELNGTGAVGSFNASGNGNFKINIFKNFGDKELSNSNPQDYQVRVYPDEYPKINIIEPEGENQAANTKEILLRSRITDDFGFSKMRLGYKISKSKYSPPDKDYRFSDIPIINLDATGLEVPYQWNLSSLNPGTEDEIEYFVEVYDNDAVTGPKMTRSETRKFIFPSLESLLNKTEKSKDEIENSLKSAYEDAMELKNELDEIKEKLDKNPEELGLNDPHKNQELQNKIQNIQNQFSATQQKLEDLMNDLQNNNQISKETLEKYMELQKMFQQIDSKELREMLKKLQEAMKNMSPDQLQEAMKNFHFDEESFQKSMEKTMELLQKILNEQKFGELTQKLDEISKEQDKIKEQTKNTDEQDKNKLNELSKSQEQLQKEYEEFQKQLQELIEKMKKLNSNDETAKQLEKLLKEMQKKNLEQKMNESSKNLQQGNKNQSQNNQQQLSSDLSLMNQMMQDILAQMLNEENSKLMAKMMEILSQLQEMSKKQGELKEQSKELDKDSDSKEFKENAKQQDELAQDLSKAIDQLMSLSQQMSMTPQMMKSLGDAYNHMKDASQSLQGKDGKSGNMSQGKAKESLDKAIERLQSMCQNGNKPGNGSSLSQLLQMLQQMIARQQMLNQKMGEIGPPGNQGQYTQEQMAQMQKLALEQETIKKNLQQLNEEFKKQQEMEGKKLLGNLDQVQKDMMEVVKDLLDNSISPETRKRQEKILSRMLDFQLSAREKDFEKRRESRPGKDFDRSSPPEIIISKPTIIDGINQDALELQKESYNEDYEVLIQKYLEKIKALRNNNNQ